MGLPQCAVGLYRFFLASMRDVYIFETPLHCVRIRPIAGGYVHLCLSPPDGVRQALNQSDSSADSLVLSTLPLDFSAPKYIVSTPVLLDIPA